jgi:GDPmannose 4,6-dehydratase
VGQHVIGINENYFRPTEVDLLIGDATKARTLLGWKPKYSLEMLVHEMMERELKINSIRITFF